MEKIKNKREAKDDQKIEEQVLKSLLEVSSPDEKFQLLLKKHVESERNLKRLRQEMKGLEKQLETVLRDKENLQREHNKSVLMCDKLQEVCREQQKIIKSVKNESMQKIREEEERRKESQSKFQSNLNEITQALSKNNDENLKLRDHNIEMTKKLKYLADQYSAREQHMEKLHEQVKLESQLNAAKLNKVQMEAAMEKEILIKEKQIGLEKLMKTQKLVAELTEREIALKEQLHLYTSKYDDFQSSLQKSNDIFATYKTELEKMSKNTKKIEKESLEWERKWEKSNATLIELIIEKKERDEHVVRCNRQVEQLQKLLRALQHERTHLYKVLRENNVETPALPNLPPEPEPMKVQPVKNSLETDKMEMMTKSCAELKQTLANLQNQMKYLNLKGAEATNESMTKENKVEQSDVSSNKKRQKKKQKSKNNKSSTITTESSIMLCNETNSESVNDLEMASNVVENIIEKAELLSNDQDVNNDIEVNAQDVNVDVEVNEQDVNDDIKVIEEIKLDENSIVTANTTNIVVESPILN